MNRDEVLTAEEAEGQMRYFTKEELEKYTEVVNKMFKPVESEKEKLLAKHILELQADKGRLTDKVRELEAENEQIKNSDTLCKLIGEQKRKIAELEAQIEKMKSQYDYAFNQLCKSREILCSMLSQYRDRKEIDYSTRECGEKLLKEEVYKNGR